MDDETRQPLGERVGRESKAMGHTTSLRGEGRASRSRAKREATKRKGNAFFGAGMTSGAKVKSRTAFLGRGMPRRKHPLLKGADMRVYMERDST